MKKTLMLCLKIIILILCCHAAIATAKNALLLNITGTIGPATESYIAYGLRQAVREEDTLVILRLDAQGGYHKPTRAIDKIILSSTIPVITYVAPGSAVAANDGIYILYASQIAVMANDAHLGFATSTLANSSIENKIKQKNLTSAEKNQEDANVNYLQNLAKMNGRNITWINDAIRNNATLSASAALNNNVINFIADSPAELLQKLNGVTVITNGVTHTFATKNLTLKTLTPDLYSQFLAVITNPDVAYVLLLLGVYGLFFQCFHQKSKIPVTIGALFLLVALYGFHLLPVNWSGIALLVLGITFMIIEVQISSFGILGLGSIIAFVVGSVLLLDFPNPGYHISWLLISSMAVLTTVFFLCLILRGTRSQRAKFWAQREALLGCYGEVIEIFNSRELLVKIDGDLWKASAVCPVKKNQHVRISGLAGMILIVEPLKKKDETIY